VNLSFILDVEHLINVTNMEKGKTYIIKVDKKRIGLDNMNKLRSMLIERGIDVIVLALDNIEHLSIETKSAGGKTYR
jgi:hypothetical protein